MEKLKKVYEGKAKEIYSTEEANLIIHRFKDSATAFDGKKKGEIRGKGKVNAQISAFLFELLEEKGIKTHLVKLLSEREILTLKLQMIPVEVVVRNVAAGSLAERLGYEEGRALRKPVVEFYYKNDALGDPLINSDHIFELGLTDEETLSEMRKIALKVNEVLKRFFEEKGLILVDFKLEFGKKNSEVILADEISPDTCRFWDKETGERLDKDRFRRDLGRVEEAYQEVFRRILHSS